MLCYYKQKEIVRAKHKDYVGESCKLHVHICLFFLWCKEKIRSNKPAVGFPECKQNKPSALRKGWQLLLQEPRQCPLPAVPTAHYCDPRNSEPCPPPARTRSGRQETAVELHPALPALLPFAPRLRRGRCRRSVPAAPAAPAGPFLEHLSFPRPTSLC